MKTLTIKITGKTNDDLEDGLQEATKRFAAGNTSGFDSRASSMFSFEIEGDDESPSFRKSDAVEAIDARVDNESNIQVHRGDRGRVVSVDYLDDETYILVRYDNGAEIVYMSFEVDYSIAPFTNEVDMSA